MTREIESNAMNEVLKLIAGQGLVAAVSVISNPYQGVTCSLVLQ